MAVIGQFKRGKSTLLNALIGTPMLPSGVTPVTGCAIHVTGGAPSAVISFKNRAASVSTKDVREMPALLDRYASEMNNSRNRLQVDRVEIAVPSASGISLRRCLPNRQQGRRRIAPAPTVFARAARERSA